MLNNFFYWWTVFWYLPLFVILVFISVNYYYSYWVTKSIFIIIAGLVIILYIELIDYWFLNPIHYRFDKNQDSINLLLINSINKFHPALLYTAIVSIIVYRNIDFFWQLVWGIVDFRGIGLYVHILYRFTNLQVIQFTLFLGSWWALQEGSWGGWWNWDPSEVFGLLIMIYILYNLHIRTKVTRMYNFNILNSWFTVSLVVVYLFIQLNFNLISHNFGLKSSNLVNTTQFLSIFTFIGILYGLFSIKNTLYTINRFILLQVNILNHGNLFLKKLISYFAYLLIVAVVVYSILFSFIPLLNDFMYKIFNINIFIYKIPIFYSELVMIILLYFYFFTKKPHILILNWSYSIYNHIWFYAILHNLTYFNVRSRLIHVILFLFIIWSYSSVSHITTTWHLNNFIGYELAIYSVDFIYTILLYTLELSHSNQHWTCFFTKSTSQDTNLFNLQLNHSITVQKLYNSFFNKPFTIDVVDYSPNPTLTFFSLGFMYYFRSTHTHLLIIF